MAAKRCSELDSMLYVVMIAIDRTQRRKLWQIKKNDRTVAKSSDLGETNKHTCTAQSTRTEKKIIRGNHMYEK